jgi:hypothetical protein
MNDIIIGALAELANAETDDFPSLIKRFKIDLASDLRHCDLRNVNFGNLIADTLDLTGCLLEGADLSLVKCKRIVRDSDKSNANLDETTELLKQALLAIYRYQNPDGLAQQVADEQTLAPIVVFYGSAAEQDFITRSICKMYRKRSEQILIEGELISGMDLVWFYTRGTKADLKLEANLLDLAFINLVREPSYDDIGIYPFRENYARVKRVATAIDEPKYRSLDSYRTQFVSAVRSQLKRATILVFSGFPPMSRQLYHDMREGLPNKFKLVFVCSRNYERQFTTDATHWRREAVPSRSIDAPIVSIDDVDNIDRRIRLASGSRIRVGSETRQRMDFCVGSPLTELKNLLVKRIYEFNADRLNTNGSPRDLLL